jgi:hypothetical protein
MKGLKIPLENYSRLEKKLFYLFENFENDISNITIHPNIITIFRFSFFSFFYYLYYNNRTTLFGLLLAFAYFINIILDYLDGHIARKYDKVTVLGDILDHTFDILGFIMFYTIINNKTILNNILIIVNLLLVLSMFAYQQKICNPTNEIKESLDLLKFLCFNNSDIYKEFSLLYLAIHLIVLFIYKNLL